MPSWLDDIVTALDHRLLQSARSGGSHGQDEHEERYGDQVELVHHCTGG